ncbi:MAG TPA: PfkB family carbohydrate kinase, partial [Lachnospiraceae bacterium]|nr:PfkB family carbohydrate kinase [Lachnospiraceae bacterium]
MIYTLTYSPSIDYLVYLDELEQGKLNLMKKDAVFYGGKGVNVSQVLQGLGVESTALGFVAGFTGREIEDGLERRGCKTDFVHLKEGHSRINI